MGLPIKSVSGRDVLLPVASDPVQVRGFKNNYREKKETPDDSFDTVHNTKSCSTKFN